MPGKSRRDAMIDAQKPGPLSSVDILDLAVEGKGNNYENKLKRGPGHKSEANNWKPKERK